MKDRLETLDAVLDGTPTGNAAVAMVSQLSAGSDEKRVSPEEIRQILVRVHAAGLTEMFGLSADDAIGCMCVYVLRHAGVSRKETAHLMATTKATVDRCEHLVRQYRRA